MPPNVWLNSKQIWENMKNHVETKGKTPWSSIGSIIYIDIKHGGTDFEIKKVKGKALFRFNKQVGLLDRFKAMFK